MLGDCYAAAVVEELSRKELMALDAAAVNYQVRQVYNWHRHIFKIYIDAGSTRWHAKWPSRGPAGGANGIGVARQMPIE